MLEKVIAASEKRAVSLYTPMLHYRKNIAENLLEDRDVLFAYTQSINNLVFLCWYENNVFKTSCNYCVSGIGSINNRELYQFAGFDEYYFESPSIQEAEATLLNLFETEEFKLKLVRYETDKLAFCDRSKVEL